MYSEVETEMLYNTLEDSCLDKAITIDGDLRECRRVRGHNDECASGFGDKLRRWNKIK